MKIRHQLNILLVIAATALMILGITALSRFERNDDLRQHLTDKAIPGYVGAAELGATLKALQISLMNLLSRQDAEAIKLAQLQVSSDKTRLSVDLEEQRKYANSEAQLGLLVQADESLKNFYDALNQSILLHQSGKAALAMAIFEGSVLQYQRELEQILETLKVEMRRNQASAIDDVRIALLYTQYILAIVVLLTIAVLIVIALRISRQINGRVAQAVHAADQVASGKLEQPVDAGITGKYDEIDNILLALESMRQSIAGQFHQILKQKNALAQQAQLLTVAKTQAEGAERLKSEFLRNISHEFRTPLNGILGVLQLLRMDNTDPDQTELIVSAEDSAKKLTELFNDMLFFASLRAGRVREKPTAFQLAETVVLQQYHFSSQAEHKGLAFSVNVHPAVPQVVIGHPDYLKRALGALLDNAIKFTSSGTITLDVDATPINAGTIHQCMLKFTVSDTGPGIPEDRIEHLFDAFVQEDGSETRQHEGTGIGLALTHALAEAMKGTLSACNRAGGGATFTLQIPVSVDPD